MSKLLRPMEQPTFCRGVMSGEPDNWKDIIPGRCKHLHIPQPRHGYLSVCVLDAPAHFQPRRAFAAILVPRGQELDWIFCTHNGLWDLLFSSSVSRLVVLRRLNLSDAIHEEEKVQDCPAQFPHRKLLLQTVRASSSPGNTHANLLCTQCYDDHNVNDDDDAFKKLFAPHLSALFPWNHCSGGPLPDPYVMYEDNVRVRLVVEVRHSEALGCDILVEDIELGSCRDDKTEVAGVKKRELRRRMRFQQMPNLIQTEVSVAIYKNGHCNSAYGLHDVKLWQQRHSVKEGMENVRSMQSLTGGQFSQMDLEVRLEHSKLVHKYLPPIVAGLVLASSCLEACIEANVRARFLTIGLGGGALPIFLHKHFGFSVLAVDTDETVIELARCHFGFVENEHLQALANDGIQVLYSVAHKACTDKLLSWEILKEWREASKDFDQGALTGSGRSDLRMHVIVVDVNVLDACSGLLSPPPCFLTQAFLLAVRMALHEGGMLVMNVIPRAENDLLTVVKSLRKVFAGIYCIQVDDNYVIFAFPCRIADIDMSSSFSQLVAHAVGEDWFDRIEEVN